MPHNEARQQIVEAFSKHWELNDLAHRQEHFEGVFQTGVIIKEKLGIDVYTNVEILFAAYFHDLFAWTRVNHHELAYEWMMTNDHPLISSWLSLPSRRSVAMACLEHRASFRGKFSSPFTELVNSADRGRPDDVKAMLERAVKYREWHNSGDSEDKRFNDSIQHLKEKFGHGGYARYPAMYEEAFGEQLAQMKDKIALL